VEITYPVQVKLVTPGADSFRPGDTVTIESSVALQPGWEFLVSPPSVEVVDINAEINLSSDAWIETCVFDCSTLPLFAPLQFFPLLNRFVPQEVPPIMGNVVSASSADPVTITPEETLEHGISGGYGLPLHTYTESRYLGEAILEATRVDIFADIGVDLDKWALREEMLPAGFDLIDYALAGYGSYSSRGTVSDQFYFEWVGMDVGLWMRVEHWHALSFYPTVEVSFQFPEPVRFTVREQSGSIVTTGTSALVSFDAGHTVEIVYPETATDIFNVVPTFSLRNRLWNSATIFFHGGINIEALRLTVGIEDVTIPGFCVPAIPIWVWVPTPSWTNPFDGYWKKEGTIPGFCGPEPVIFPAVEYDLGPVYESTVSEFYPRGHTTLFYTYEPWELGGFNTSSGGPFLLDPQLPPTACISAPSEANEGQTINLDGSCSSNPDGDPLTYSWDFGDGTTSTDVTTTRTYTDDDTYTVTLTVDDGGGGQDSATTTVTVNNVAPEVDAGPDATIDEGDTFVSSGSFADPGDDTWTATVDYGDGSGVQTLSLTGMTFSLDHTYADNGVHTVTVTVTDDDDGVGTDTVSVTVNNVAPSITAVGDEIDENGVATVSGTISDPGAMDTFTVVIDWGEGLPETFNYPAGTTSYSETHQYLDDEPSGTSSDQYGISVTVTDDDGGEGSTTTTVTVNNVAPEVDAGPDATINEGNTFVSSGSFTDPGDDTWRAKVDYGDGSDVQTLSLNADKTFSLDHTYADNDVCTVTITVTDDDTGVGTDTATVTVNNVAPSITAVGDEIDENDVATVSGTISDPGAMDTFTVVIDWGEGLPETFNYPAGATSFSETHQYLDDDPSGTSSDDYSVSVTVTDDDGDEDSTSTTVTVNNVAPRVDAGPDADINEGDTFTSSGSFVDPGADTWTATVDYGDGSGVQTLSLNADMTFGLSHTYDDNDVYTVTVTVTDDDTGVGTDTATVTVNNVAPTVNAGPDAENFSGQTHQLNASFTDPGILDTHTAEIDWGDGSDPEDGEVVELDGSGTLTGSHQYFVPGEYIITVTVIDKDGDEGSDSIIKTIVRLPVRIDIKPGSDPNSINLGSKGKLPVSVFGGEYEGVVLDASAIDWSSVVFGGAPALDIGRSPAEDLDDDGYLDQTYHFNTQDTDLTGDSTEARLTGMTTGNIYFEGYDGVRVVPPKKGRK